MNKVLWSSQARITYRETLEFILLKWTVKEAVRLEDAVNNPIEKLERNPELCPGSRVSNLRKCVVSKQTSMIYSKSENEVTIIAFIDNRSNHKF